MKKQFQVIPLTVEQMLSRPEREYNQSIWEEKVKRWASFPKIQFYVVEKNDVYSYTRFYASYTGDGIYLFNSFGYSSCLTSNGFCKVTIDEEGNVFKSLFHDATGKEGYAENCKANRESFRKHETPRGIMISNCI